MKLVVGLGNPGDGYADTYHNIGFIALDFLSAHFDAPAFTQKDNALVTDIRVCGDKVILCKPTTYMNLSGDAVSRLARYYKIEPEDILVVYDDIDIKKGIVRVRPSGSAGTHNGMRDIVEKLGSTAFPRVRIGTGFKPNYMALADYVLSHIPAAEKQVLHAAAKRASELICDWLNGTPWQEQTVSVV